MADEKPKPTVALKNFFGLKEGEDLQGFLAELNALSDEEKAQLAEGIINGTLNY